MFSPGFSIVHSPTVKSDDSVAVCNSSVETEEILQFTGHSSVLSEDLTSAA